MYSKKWLLTLFAVCITSGCSSDNPEPSAEAEQEYFAPLYSVLQAHGGIEGWNEQQTLSFELGNEKHVIDLKSREIKITSSDYVMGNDNGTVWIKQDSTYFQGSPTFHHSLMFYFHTMPFVLADDGINYEEASDKEIMGTTYKGIHISFNEGVGDSPEDEYVMYYHPETKKMEWLAYTVTFRSQEKSNDFSMIHYKNWEETNGFLLPTELQWHTYENGEVGEARGEPRFFTDVSVSKDEMDDTYFDMPEGAEVDSVERK